MSAKRWLSWCAWNGAFVALIVAATQVGWAFNVLAFVVWSLSLLLVVSLALVVMVAAAEAGRPFDPNSKEPPNRAMPPAWAENSYDLGVLIALAAMGWFVTAFGYLIGCIAQRVLAVTMRRIHAEWVERKQEYELAKAEVLTYLRRTASGSVAESGSVSWN